MVSALRVFPWLNGVLRFWAGKWWPHGDNLLQHILDPVARHEIRGSTSETTAKSQLWQLAGYPVQHEESSCEWRGTFGALIYNLEEHTYIIFLSWGLSFSLWTHAHSWQGDQREEEHFQLIWMMELCYAFWPAGGFGCSKSKQGRLNTKY